ncbi:ATP synthase epsilon chain [Waddlia chondrophila 2032/99]|uniref:ATP synthase epsilon chain n=2 Tax=Waddlia chondrophila TaxID=71667 RepID=D6YWH5_WADCW|nr:ATP synthase F1 subunit epsilon [Waddlia chondrophila]ADI38486.1 F-type ATP synthase, subunit epsilon [Waddlia chondrophila WSU 86-1044]CCB91568.1 ATP synthase epsilon chain [Waddlia chondrophila 2032/99]
MFSLKILTIDKKVYEGKALSLTIPGTLGYFEVLNNHASLMTPLQPGKLAITFSQQEKSVFAISGGIMEMHQNQVTILGDTIESAGEIDYDRAKAAYQKAYKLLEFPEEEIDQHEVTQALLRAKNRMEIAASSNS